MSSDSGVAHLSKKERRALIERYRVTDGKGFRLKHYDPADTDGCAVDEGGATDLLAQGVQRLSELQEQLYAQGEWALLCVFQAMDAAGKDGTIKHVLSGVNPQGVSVTSFKAPGPEELAHDFLWRVSRALPARGQIGIFNRSHYEDVLVVRVHPELLETEHLAPALMGKKLWEHRCESIVDFERHLGRQGVVVLKFFLHISREEQRKRFLARLDERDKLWKFSANDLRERAYWDNYQEAYEEAIAATAAKHAPWFIVPADSKWFMRMIVVEAVVAALESLDLRVPTPTPEELEAFDKARRELTAEGAGR